ncbi:MAG: hypothetical protein HY928_15990 [Elusimicrobia bacterium]|nr:hypothetical protein [Elusimicrobiota bacterium]
MKKTAASLIATLQALWAMGPGVSEVLAQYNVRAQVQAPVVSVGVAPVPVGSMAPLSVPTLSGFNASLASPSVLPTLPALASPTASPRAASAQAAAAASVTAAPLAQARAAAPLFASPVLRAPAVGATPAKAEAAAQREAAKKEGLELSAQASEMPVEGAKGSAASSFEALLNRRLISGSGDVAAPAAAVRAELTGRAASGLLAPSAPAAQAKAEPVAPSAAPAQASFWSRPAVRKTALALGLVTAAAAAPFLVPHAGIVAALGSAALTVIGIPQIVKNFKGGKATVKDLVIASPLIWFGAATLLSVVSIGQGASIWWNLANVAGVLESAIVIGQINWYKRDKAEMKASALTVAASLAPLPLIATQALMPLKAWLDLSFTGAMGLLWVLNFPQIRHNFRVWETEKRVAEGVAPLYPALVAGGSLLHLFTALVTGDLRWAMNAGIGILTAGIVLGQIYAPRVTNALVGPIVRLVDKVLSLVSRGRGAEGKGREAAPAAEKAELAPAFDGADLSSFAGPEAKPQLDAMTARAKALPGRSVIFLEAPTAAGKSTLAKSLEAGLGGRIRSLEVDRYFKSRPEVPVDAKGQPDFDRPDAMLLERVAADIRTLLAGGRVELPVHDMASGVTRFDSGEYMQLGPDEVLVVDSIFASHPGLLAAARGHESLNVYLDAPAVVRLARRLARDRVARGKPIGENLKGWARILENEKTHILPLKGAADMVLNLVGAEELAGLQDSYAKLLAEERAAGRGTSAEARLLAEMIRASLEADRGVPVGPASR